MHLCSLLDKPYLNTEILFYLVIPCFVLWPLLSVIGAAHGWPQLCFQTTTLIVFVFVSVG